jgi:hypothetical protein
MSRHVLIPLVLIASACATAGRVPVPLPKTPGQPTPFSALGKKYSVPVDLDIPDTADGPGWKVMDFTDQVTACDGAFYFTTVASPEKHKDLVKNIKDDKRRNLEPRVKVVERVGPTLTVLGEETKTAQFDLTTASAQAAMIFIDRHVAAQNLSLLGVAFCEDPGLIKVEIERIGELFNSQQTGQLAAK